MRTRRSCRRPLGQTLLWYPDRARWCGLFSEMPNIKQQKKRVRIAGEERLENLRYRSTIKTLTKRLATAAEGGDSATVESGHRELELQLVREPRATFESVVQRREPNERCIQLARTEVAHLRIELLRRERLD